LVAPASPETHAQHVEHDGDDGWLSSWEQELRAENAQNDLIAQVQAASLNGPETPRAGPQGKGKKKKKITLMSTTARRAA